MTARQYQPVLQEITTALFACPDCGAIVWYALRAKHDQLHTQIDGLIAGSWKHAELLDADGDRLNEHANQIAGIQGQVGDLDSSLRRLSSDVTDVGYRVDDAKRTADDAARNASRGW